MPPLKGIDRGINGDLLKALEESGHESQIVVVDPSYAIPFGQRVADYQGDSSAQALRGILELVPFEGDRTNEWGFDVLCMLPDTSEEATDASDAFMDVIEDMSLNALHIPREDLIGEPGFYSTANDPEKQTLFVRTRDEKAYACAMFIVGHSQK